MPHKDSRTSSGGRRRTELDLRYAKIQTWKLLGHALIKFGCLAWLGYCGLASVQALAGQETLAKFIIAFMGRFDTSLKFSWTLTGLLATYSVCSTVMFKREIRRLGDLKETLEKLIDPGRSSSRLVGSADTRKEDRLK